MRFAGVTWLRAQLRSVWAVCMRFHTDDCFLRASALAYASLLSIVPLLAVMFAVLKGLGLPRRMEQLLLAKLALPPETMASLVAAVERVNVNVVGAFGALFLLISVISVLGAIESALNHIWRVQQGRDWWRRLSEYSGLVLLTPFLLLGAIAFTSSLRLGHAIRLAGEVPLVGKLLHSLWILAPIALNVVGLLLLYVVLPNRKPKWRAVVVGAIVGGVLWQVVQWLYVTLQIGVARYGAIYGAMAQLPITLVWLYASWAVFLFGAECAAAVEFGADSGKRSFAPRSILALQALRSAWLEFRGGGGSGVNPAVWAKEHNVKASVAWKLFRQLAEWGWLQQSGSGNGECYVVRCHPRSWDLGRLADFDGMESRAYVDEPIQRWCNLLVLRNKEHWKQFADSGLYAEVLPGVERPDHIASS